MRKKEDKEKENKTHNLEENKSSNLILFILGIFIICSSLWLTVTMFFSDEKYISSDKVSVITDTIDSEGIWEKVEKIVVETMGIVVDAYSFDGGLNWQDSNEYYATEKETLIIIVRDVNGKQTEPIKFETMNIDSVPPVISVKLPSKVLQNSKINLGEYVSVTDDNSGVDGTIIMSPNSLDTSKLGKTTITFSAKDKAGNASSIVVTVEVVKDGALTEQTAKVYYRYRVKNVTEYECKTYDCSYYEEGKVHSEGMLTHKCSNAYSKKLTFKNGCYIVPSGKDVGCTQVITTVDRYSEYKKGDWTYIIDIIALDSKGNQVEYDEDENNSTSFNNSTVNSSEINNNVDGESSSILNTLKIKYKSEPCDENEISINGYCHAICSGEKEIYCDEGYSLIDGKCQKRIERKCSDTCTNYTWSEWSEWSETVVIPSDTIQVETKVVTE